MKTNSPHLQNTLSARTIQPDDIPVGDISTKLVGYAAVLFRFDEISGEILFKNAWCDEWDCGDMFSISSLRVLSPSPDNRLLKFVDICCDFNKLPSQGIMSTSLFAEAPHRKICEVGPGDISYDSNAPISESKAGVIVYAGKFRFGCEIDVAVKVFPPMSISELNASKS